MRIWKRSAAFLASMSLLLTMCACSGEDTAVPANPPEQPPYSTESQEPETPSSEPEQPEGQTEAEPKDELEEQAEAGPKDETEEQTEAKAEKPEGLVILKEAYDTKQKIYEIYCFNLETKEETLIASFQIPLVMENGDIYAVTAFGYSAAVTRTSFSSDYSKLADQKIFAANNERHAGWHTTGGDFIDVTEALGQQSKSDFDSPVNYNSRGFVGENFGYLYLSPDAIFDPQDFYVPIDNLSADAVREGNILTVGRPYNEDGALIPRKYGGAVYFQDVTAWIDDTHAIANTESNDSYSSCIVDTVAQTLTDYIPGDSRNNWNGVISPDGTRIAFMSEPKGGSDISTDIYIVPVDGGDPVKVEGHSFDLKGKFFKTKTGTCTLIDWI